MDMLTGIRPPLPVADASPPSVSGARPAEAGPLATRPEAGHAVAPGTTPPQDSAAGARQFLAAQAGPEASASARAEAARDAYIKASIAAGLNPLPMP